MNARSAIELAAAWTARFGLTGVKDLLYPVYYVGLRPFERFTDPGVNVYDLEWDLLVVLDACRADLLGEVGDREWIDRVGSYRSVGSMTRDWMARTFTGDRADAMAGTAYVCANPFSGRLLDPGDFARLEEVWREAWAEPGTVPPRAVTDRVVEVTRETEADRTIAHYLQPHCPFIDRPELSRGKEPGRFGSNHWPDVWERHRMGHVSRSDLWDGYRSNAERALDEVERLLGSVDADEVVVTSDHGNGVGEAGVYGHPPGQWIDAVRDVPLVRTTAADAGERRPAGEHDAASEHDAADERVEPQLEALGYR